MRSASVRRLRLGLVVTLLAVAVMFVASTWGLSAWNRAQPVPETSTLSLPVAVDTPPPSVATTDEYGPPGTVALVFAGTEVADGLFGEVDRPWLTVAAETGDYRALVVPGLPRAVAGGIAVSSAGDRLAWATGDGVSVYDPLTGRVVELPLPRASRVAAFSADGSMLLVHADGLRILDVATGVVVASAQNTDVATTLGAAWRPDSSAVDYVAHGQLVTVPTGGGAATTQPSPFSESARLAWSPSGQRLVGMQQVDDIPRLLEAPLSSAGRIGHAEQVDTSGIALEGLIGFSGEESVAVTAYFLESGAVERLIDVSLDGGSPVDLTTLPSPGENWVGSHTMAVAGDALRTGSNDFGNPLWPWSHRARLVACFLVGLFGLGLWLTRRPRAGRRR